MKEIIIGMGCMSRKEIVLITDGKQLFFCLLCYLTGQYAATKHVENAHFHSIRMNQSMCLLLSVSVFGTYISVFLIKLEIHCISRYTVSHTPARC